PPRPSPRRHRPPRRTHHLLFPADDFHPSQHRSHASPLADLPLPPLNSDQCRGAAPCAPCPQDAKLRLRFSLLSVHYAVKLPPICDQSVPNSSPPLCLFPLYINPSFLHLLCHERQPRSSRATQQSSSRRA